MPFSAGELLSTIREKAVEFSRRPARLLLAAALLHLAATVTVYSLGRARVFPSVFDENGIAVSFAIDGTLHRVAAASLSDALEQGRVLDWLRAEDALHVKLYSLCFLLFGPLLGTNILSVEPLNAFYYLAILILVFKLGREIFSRRVGLLAAGAVAVWPTFLLHTTQMLRDPLFIAGMLALIFLITLYLTRRYSWRSALLKGAAGGLVSFALWLGRANMMDVVTATVLLGAGLLVVARFKREGRVAAANLTGMALLAALTLSVQLFPPETDKPVRARSSSAAAAQGTSTARGVGGDASVFRAQELSPSLWSRLARRVGRARYRFIIRYKQAGSNIDTDVELMSMKSLLLYLPRAALIGFFAPFPDMWGVVGRQVGASGRLLAGLECLAMYAFEAFALLTLWRERRRLPVWLLFLTAAVGMVALGLVVVNVGSLFRMRYVFLMPVVILGFQGAGHALLWFREREARRGERDGRRVLEK